MVYTTGSIHVGNKMCVANTRVCPFETGFRLHFLFRTCLILFLSHYNCSCEQIFGQTYQIKNSLTGKDCLSEHIERSFVTSVELYCLHKCSRQCSIGIFYNSRDGVCKCCTGFYTTPDGLPTDVDAQYYSIQPDSIPDCANYLVGGPNGVEDSQLTQSTHFCQYNDCGDYTSVVYARLNSASAWIAPDNTTQDDYVQVDFWQLKTITAIALRGRTNVHGGPDQYVTSFKVHTSGNCQQFTVISNANGSEKIFNGTNSPDAISIRYLPERVLARCVRVNPITYVGIHKSLRFDVLGCSCT